MNCIAVDDEPLALNVIKEFCEKVDFLNLIGTFSSPIDATKAINENAVDLIFLDIQMPHITGLEFLKSLTNPPLVIFTTAYSEHALEGFKLDAVDYLVKPIPFNQFLKAVNKAYELFYYRTREEENPKAETNTDYLMVRVDYSTVRVNFKDIKYIEGLKDYIKIYTGGRPLLTKSTMKNIQERLPGDEFIRIHKSFIINLSSIDKIENNRVVFGETWLPVGNFYRDEFLKCIAKHRL